MCDRLYSVVPLSDVHTLMPVRALPVCRRRRHHHHHQVINKIYAEIKDAEPVSLDDLRPLEEEEDEEEDDTDGDRDRD